MKKTKSFSAPSTNTRLLTEALSPPVPCIDGIYYVWLPIVGNPSCLVLHRWLPEEDKWKPLDDITCVPSAEWGTNTLRN